MSLRFIYGKTGCGKTTLCLKEITKGSEDVNYIYIVPEQFSLESEKALSSFAENEVRMNKTVYSFNHLAMQMISKYGNTKKIFDSTGKNMLLRKLAFDKKDELKFYKNSFDKNGFLDKLSQTITEFTKGGIYPCELEEKIDEKVISESKIENVKYKLEDINNIYKAYCDYISNEVVSEDTVLDVLTELIPQSEALKGSCIWIDGFNGFTVQELVVIRELLKVAKVVTVCLNLPYKNVEKPKNMFDVYSPTKNTYFDLLDVAAMANMPIKDSVFLSDDMRHNNSAELKHLAQNYLKYKSDIYTETVENIKVYAANDIYEEINTVCYSIRQLVSQNNYSYSDIGIIMGDNDYSGKLRTAMMRYEIPCHIDERKSIISNLFTQFIVSAVNVMAYDFKLVDVVEFLKTGFTKITDNDIYLIENYLIANDINGFYRWKQDEWIAGFNESDFYREKINGIKNKITDIFEPLTVLGAKNQKVTDITKAIYNFIYKNDVPKILAAKIEYFRKKNNLDAVDEYEKIWDIIKDLFEKLTMLMGEQKVSMTEYVKILKSGLVSTTIGTVPPVQDYVVVGDFERTRFSNIKTLFLMGLNEGVVPPYHDDTGILLDNERRLLTENGIKLADDSLGKINRDKYLIYTSLCKPTEKLILTYPKKKGDNEEDNAWAPSMVINKIREIFPNLKVGDGIKSANAHIPAFELFVEDFYNIDNKADYDFWCQNEEYKEKLQRIVTGINREAEEKMLSKEIASQVFGDTVYSSVSKMETYTSCPFSFFLKYILKARERKNFKIDNSELGNVYHSVMEQYMRDKAQNNVDWENVKYDDIKTAVDEVTDRVVSEYENFNMSARLKQLTKRLKHKMSRSVWAAVEQVKAGKYNPAFFELEFGKEDGLPPIIFELDNGIKIELTGKIDRIDICDSDGKSYVKIVDYKSSEKGCNLSEIYAGLQLQLATYMSRLTNSEEGFFGRDRLEPGGMFYFKISDPIISADDENDTIKISNEQITKYTAKGIYLNENKDSLGNSKTIENKIAVTDEEFKIILNYVNKLIKIIGTEMTEGKIQAKPYLKSKDTNNETTACEYCLYSSICKIDDKSNDTKYNVINDLPEKVALEKFRESLNPEDTEN